jgi:hypothetical protein
MIKDTRIFLYIMQLVSLCMQLPSEMVEIRYIRSLT